jgi:hypothetical protein
LVLSDAERFDHSHYAVAVMSSINQMFAQKSHLNLVRAQHFADEKIISAIVARFYRTPCQFSSLTNDGLALKCLSKSRCSW